MQRLVSASLMLLLAGPTLAQQSPSDQAGMSHGSVRLPNGANVSKKNVSVAGSVIGLDGKTAVHASVYLSWFTEQREVAFHRVETESDGTFKITVAVPMCADNFGYMITALLPGKGMAWHEIPAGELSQKQDLRLQASTAITGKLVRLDGSPAAHTPVQLAGLYLQSGQGRRRSTTQMGNQGRFLTDEAVAKLFKTTTDAQGRFMLTGLPRTGIATLQTTGELTLAPGSNANIALMKQAKQDLGILAAVKPGTLTGVVRDHITGKPIARATVLVTGKNGFVMNAATDINGALDMQGMMPGTYAVSCKGYRAKVEVPEGAKSRPVVLAVRQGALIVRVLDANGKPAANVPVRMFQNGMSVMPGEAGSNNRFSQRAMNNVAEGDDDAALVRTNAQGRICLPDFAWGMGKITVAAAHDNDAAEWSGNAQDMAAKMELHLQPAARITIRGRLIDPERRPVTQVTFQTLHWQPSPRSTWFATSHTVQADAQGRFCVTGLERGESFSMITASDSFNPDGRQAAKFESPRFETSTTKREQELGDVMVHPLEEQDDIGQVYGFGTTHELAGMMKMLPPASADDVLAAQQAFAQYRNAMQAGDVTTLHRLTSQFSTGWSEPRSQFLLTACLRPAANALPAEKTTGLRFVTELAAAQIISVSNTDANATHFNGQGLPDAARLIGNGRDWVFLGALSGETLRFAGALHRESGQWRVVSTLDNNGMFNIESTVIVANDFNPVQLTENAVTKPAPLPAADELSAARTVGEQYLTAWAHEKMDATFALTGENAPDHAKKLATYQKRMAARQDEGFCPLGPDDTFALQTASDLTKFDLLQIAQIAIARNDVSGRSSVMARNADFPIRDIEKGELIGFRYTAQDRTFLMLLEHRGGTWRVVEPAMPL